MDFRGQKGFTLVELVIVLAIAALILTGILMAVAGANQSTRDATRRNNIGRMETALEQWASTHNGTYKSGASVVQVEELYSNACGSPGIGTVQYLDCGVKPPGGGGIYQSAQNNPNTSTVRITDRSGIISGDNGYCVVTQLEGGNGAYFGATDQNKAGHTMDPATCQ